MDYKVDVNVCRSNRVKDDDSEEFSLDGCAFPMAKQPESYNDVSISDMLTSEPRSEVETLIEQYPEVLSSLPRRTDQTQHDIKLRQNQLGRKVIPFRLRHVTSWKQKFKK